MVSVQAGAGGHGWKELPDWDTVACVCTVKHRSVLTTADWQVRFPAAPPPGSAWGLCRAYKA